MKAICKISLLSAVLIFAAGPAAWSVRAGDTTQYKTVQTAPPPAFNWTGFYIGLHVGYGWGDGTTSFTPLPSAAEFINLAPTSLKTHPDGVLGGGQVGYNYQMGIMVFGVETDFSGTAMNQRVTRSPIIQNDGTAFPGAGFLTTRQDINWFGTVRGRIGITPIRRLLLYGTGGFAYGSISASADSVFLPPGTTHYPVGFDEIRTGWTAGGGLEYALNRNWSIKAEYLYLDFGNRHRTANAFPALPPFQVRYNFETTANTVNVGINYKF